MLFLQGDEKIIWTLGWYKNKDNVTTVLVENSSLKNCFSTWEGIEQCSILLTEGTTHV